MFLKFSPTTRSVSKSVRSSVFSNMEILLRNYNTTGSLDRIRKPFTFHSPRYLVTRVPSFLCAVNEKCNLNERNERRTPSVVYPAINNSKQ